jgi:hypothetical protein
MDPATITVARLAIVGGAVAPLVLWSLGSWRGRFPGWLTLSRRRLLLTALVVVGWAYLVWYASSSGPGYDARAYWAVDLGTLYAADYGVAGHFVYSPAAAILSLPLGLLPEHVFLLAWTVLMLGATVWLARGEALVWLAFPPLICLVFMGNIEILIGVAVVLGFRHPWTWSFVLLTKVTPGVGLLWFAVRREWRELAVALGATAAIVAVTYMFVPDAWHEWLAFLSRSQGTNGWAPLLPRLVAAAALLVWGARSGRRWTVVVAAMLAVPHFWFATLGGLVAVAGLGFSWAIADSRATGSQDHLVRPRVSDPAVGADYPLARGSL